MNPTTTRLRETGGTGESLTLSSVKPYGALTRLFHVCITHLALLVVLHLIIPGLKKVPVGLARWASGSLPWFTWRMRLLESSDDREPQTQSLHNQFEATFSSFNCSKEKSGAEVVQIMEATMTGEEPTTSTGSPPTGTTETSPGSQLSHEETMDIDIDQNTEFTVQDVSLQPSLPVEAQLPEPTQRPSPGTPVPTSPDGATQMSPEPKHPQVPTDKIFNDRLRPAHKAGVFQGFTLFPHLPCEIRLKIWNFALQRHRFIRLYSNWGSFKAPAVALGSKLTDDAYTKNNENGNVISGQLYMAHAGPHNGCESRRFPSALMAVCHEARKMALEFYYLSLPASDRAKYQHDGKPPVIYLNPDWDYIRLIPKVPTDMLDFLWDCRAYDPKGRGIKKWVLTPHDIRTLVKSNCGQLHGWDTPAARELGALLRGLETVMFSHRDIDKTRANLVSNTSSDSSFQRDPLQPFFARPSEFTLLEKDLRPQAANSMSHLWVMDSPSRARMDFSSLLRYCIDEAHLKKSKETTEITHMVCIRPEWKRCKDGFHAEWITDQQDFEDFLLVDALSKQANKVTQSVEDHHFQSSHEDVMEMDEEVGGTSAEALSMERVAGFWILPTEAFEDGPNANCLATINDRTLWTVSEHSPQLAVFSLPSTARVR